MTAQDEGKGWEAVVDGDGDAHGVYDPVVSIVIRTSYHDYELSPADVRSIIVLALPPTEGPAP